MSTTTQDDMWKKYCKAIIEGQQEEDEKFFKGVEGWYGPYYYKMVDGCMTRVESIYGDDPPYYTD